MTRYTAITFAPVQAFIEKSRKLRDLYGSSFILSFLAKSICQHAQQQEGVKVILPALIDTTRGTPNNIYLTGELEEAELRTAFHTAWKALVDTCRQYIEDKCPEFFRNPVTKESWTREWNLWANQAWELFIIVGTESESLEDVRRRMSDRKQARDWIGINWKGESSSISGTDSIAYPGMATFNPTHSMAAADQEIAEFYQALSNIAPDPKSDSNTSATTTLARPKQKLPDAFVEARENLSIPDLIKRLVTYSPVAQKLQKEHSDLPQIERLGTFRELERKESNLWTGWFQGDGDRIGAYISSLVESSKPTEDPNAKLQKFSQDMMNWGEDLQKRVDEKLTDGLKGRIIYAGGDDFLGVLYRPLDPDKLLTPQECLKQWWYGFDKIWDKCGHDISVSTGFVWAAPNIPQRDLLQHLRLTEKNAKSEGRDRLAIRILFNSGNHLDWSCPWRFLKDLLESYQDRSQGKNWTHIYSDIALLESRHAFTKDDCSVAEGILKVYFPSFKMTTDKLWNPVLGKGSPYQRLASGLLGSKPNEPTVGQQHQAECQLYNQWVINLAKVGFHLFPDSNRDILTQP